MFFKPTNQNSIDFLIELQSLAKHVFGITSNDLDEQISYAETTPDLQRSHDQTHCGNASYQRIVTHFEKELQLNFLGASD